MALLLTALHPRSATNRPSAYTCAHRPEEDTEARAWTTSSCAPLIPFDAGGAAPHLGALWGSFCVVPAARSLGSRSLGGNRRDPEDVYDPAVARREREILEHAVHAVTKQAATADDLVDEALDDEAVVVGTSGPIR